MSSTTRLILFGALVALAATALQYAFADPFAWLDARAYDALSARLDSGNPSDRIVIADIDEKSLAARGRWPWPRTLLAQLTTNIRRAGASFIALDMVFADPDPSTGIQAGAPQGSALAAAFGEGPTAAGFYFDFEPRPDPASCSPPAVPLVFKGDDAPSRPRMATASGAVCNLPGIAASLAASGFLNAGPDSDGILRRLPLLVRYQGRAYPSLPLAVYLALATPDPLVLDRGPAGDLLQAGRLLIPVDSQANMLVRFHGPAGAFPHYPAADILSGSIARPWLENKIVIIGSSAPGRRESASTPVDPIHPGVDLQAAALDNLLHGDFLHRSTGAWFWEKAVALLLGIAATAVLSTRSGAWRYGIAVSQGALLWLAVWTSLSRDGSYFSPIPATATLSFVVAAFGVRQLVELHRRAEEGLRKLAAARKFTLDALAAVMEVRDAETGAHLLRTQNYTRILCGELSHHPRFRTFLTAGTVEMLVQLAPIHDIGKIGIPDRILRKPGPLTREEFAFMRRHVEFGCEVIERASRRSGVKDEELLSLARDIICAHHEHWNGNGYPRGLRGDAIPIAGRLLALVDMYDALVSRRAYKESYPHQEARRMIETARGAQFDPDVVDAFVRTQEHWMRIAEEFRGDRVES